MLLPSAHLVAPGAHTPVHMLDEHAWPTQVDGAPQVPAAEQVRMRVESRHSVVPGAHSPLHTPCTHACLTQALALPQVPSSPQVARLMLSTQETLPGVHSPLQAAGEPVQAELAHSVATSQVASVRQTRTSVLLTHSARPGVHSPLQASLILSHRNSQSSWVCQAPSALHACSTFTAHCLLPTLQVSAHAPAAHSTGHFSSTFQAPATHVRRLPLPSQSSAPGTHSPVQTPSSQTKVHFWPGPQSPFVSHSWRSPASSQRAVPESHTDASPPPPAPAAPSAPPAPPEPPAPAAPVVALESLVGSVPRQAEASQT